MDTRASLEGGVANVWSGSPRFMQPTSAAPGPGYGPTRGQFSTGPGRQSFWQQGAFYGVYAPQMGRTTAPDPGQLDLLFQTAPDTGVPRFFRWGVRAAASDNSISGKPEGLRMLLVPPDRFNALANVRRKPKDVRQGRLMAALRPSRARAAGAPMGG